MRVKKLRYFIMLIKRIIGLDSHVVKERGLTGWYTYHIVTTSNKNVPLGQTTLTIVDEIDDLGDMLFGEAQGMYNYYDLKEFTKQVELEYFKKWPRKNLI